VDSLTLHSYAKINLYLEVLGLRRDNFHNIRTVFERIDLHDKIILKARRDKKIRVFCDAPRIPKDSSKNLAFRSAKLLQDTLQIDKGADIRVIKRIPVAAGLGGGSSNAASVLMGLNKLWGLGLSRNKLVSFARKIGSDVPFFVYDTAFAQGRGRGDIIKPLSSLNKTQFWHILVVPRITVLTAKIYKEWEKLKVRLTRAEYDVKILTLALRKKDTALINPALFNSLEQATARLYPGVRLAKESLAKLGLKSILMSGSGPAIFGVISSRKEAVSLYKQLKTELKKKHASWQVFVAKTR
jgi:4-diphosphocytidyl-2-C-methyl-D-erythritol kinase